MGFWNTFYQYFTKIPRVSDAVEFYRVHILKGNSTLAPICERYGCKSHIPSWKWEMFAAILVNDTAKGGNGSDLLHHEVKSVKKGNSFEYQYHCNSWKEKLDREYEIDHVFITYEPGYRNVVIRKISGADLATIFDTWRVSVKNAYSNKPRQRCRKSLSHTLVADKGTILLDIEGGKLKHFDPYYFSSTK